MPQPLYPIVYICTSWIAFFSPPCSLLDLICFFFMPNNLRLPLRFFLKKREGLLREDVLRLRFVDTLEYEAQFTLPCFAVTRNVFVTACFVWKYSCCEPHCEELCHLVTDILLVTLLGAKTEAHFMCTVARYITAKKDSTNCLYMIKCQL